MRKIVFFPSTTYGTTFKFDDFPEWTKDYKWVTIHQGNLENYRIVASNNVVITKSDNITYGVWHDVIALTAVCCRMNAGVWGEPYTDTNVYLGGQSPYVDYSYAAKWTNRDLYCRNDNEEEYLLLEKGSWLVCELGWTDDSKEIDTTLETVYLYDGWSVAGDFRCQVVEASNDDTYTFTWSEYIYGTETVLIHRNRTYSDFKPSTENGNMYYRCSISNAMRDIITTDDVCVYLVSYKPSGNPFDVTWGSSSDAYLTNILLDYKTTAVPGETVNIGVTLVGVGSYYKSYNASISGEHSSDTILKKEDGLSLTVGMGETAESVSVNISAANITKTATVKILGSDAPTEPGNWHNSFQTGLATGLIGNLLPFRYANRR